MGMGILTKAQILEARDLEDETVEVPEWGGSVKIRSMSGADRDKFEASLTGTAGKRDLTNIRARLVALTLVDETGELMFEMSEVSALGAKSAAALDLSLIHI